MKTSILFDGNHFLHRSLGVASTAKDAEYGKPLDFREDPDGDRRLLLQRMSEMFAAEIGKFSGVADQVVYCVDSPSWRKIAFPSEDYKGNREKDSDTDWKAITSTYIEFQEAIAKVGVVIARTPGAEADDLLFYWSSVLNHWGGRNAVVISGDGDLLQLVSKDPSTGAFTIVFDKLKSRACVFEGFSLARPKEPSLDVFDVSDVFGGDAVERLKESMWKAGVQIEEFNPSRFIFKKVLTGDQGDNVKSVFQRVKSTKAGDRTYRITPLMAERVLDVYEREHMFFGQQQMFDTAAITEIMTSLRGVAKITDDDATVEQLVERWKVNRDLMYLHSSCIPDSVKRAMHAHYDANKDSTTPTFSAAEILEGCPSCTIDRPEPNSAPTGGGFDRDKWKNYRQ